MDAVDLLPLLEELDDNVDDLEEALAPILNATVTATSKKLPVLDKAKFHVLVTYALESLIFSYLRLHGVNAKEHPVFREITRVKQYFAKIKALETEPEQRTMTLDKDAAARFIKHGLAGNDKIDLERKEQEAKEKARAQLKASILAKKAESAKKNSNDSNAEPGPDDSEGEAVKEKKKSKNKDSKKTKSKSDKSGEKSSKKKRSKEGRKEESRERRKKKMDSRKARET